MRQGLWLKGLFRSAPINIITILSRTSSTQGQYGNINLQSSSGPHRKVAKTLMEERLKEFSAGSGTKMKVRWGMGKQKSTHQAKSWIQ